METALGCALATAARAGRTTGGGCVPKYVTLCNWTDQGVASAKDTVIRYQAAKRLVESKGGKIDAIFWTVGPYDLVTVADSRR